MRNSYQGLLRKIREREAEIGIIGLGYVGLPLCVEFCRAGFRVTGFDTDPERVQMLRDGQGYIRHIALSDIHGSRLFSPTTDFSLLRGVDCIIICVPTPLNKNREPDMSYILETAETIAGHLRRGHLIVLESTTYPGTTEEVLRPLLEKTGLRAGDDFYLAYSPERVDPGSRDFSISEIPKVVGGSTGDCLEVARALYETIVIKTVPVSSTRVAEAAKLLENIYRAVNIALVNELKMLFDRMGIDIWEVIEAAKTKPFGFHAFYPGPGLGGHCIPVDPFYLTWKAREYDFYPHFIELAGEINTNMPYYVVSRVLDLLGERGAVRGARVLVLGIAYKRDVDDLRESPALKIIELLKRHGVDVVYNDPHIPLCREHPGCPDIDMGSVELTEEILNGADITLLVTDHSAYDYAFIERNARLIVDTRDAFRRNGIRSEKIYRA